MKHLIVIFLGMLFFVSCKKDIQQQIPNLLSPDQQFFNTIQVKLKDSLPAKDYSRVNFAQVYKSKDAQSSYYFVRIGLLNKDLATDFILLQTDSLGNVLVGKLIHVDKEKLNTPKPKKFNGKFTFTSLNGKNSNTQEVTNGKWKNKFGATAMAQPVEDDEPAGEQTLPDVVVTSYTSSGASFDWYWYGGFFSEGDGGYSDGGGYTYGAAHGGGGTGDNTVKEDDVIELEAEYNDDPAIDVSKYVKCFSTIGDANATCQITIFSDVPVNSEPSFMFNPSTGSPGHTFIQLRKSDGANSVQQNLGFYPNTGWKSLTRMNIDSKVVDNEGHEYNASLTMNVNTTQFQAALDRLQSIAGNDYNIEKWNCTDFALSVFNAAATVPLQIPQMIIPGDVYNSNTPQGLYTAIKNLQSSNNTAHGTPEVPGVCGYAGSSHGECQ